MNEARQKLPFVSSTSFRPFPQHEAGHPREFAPIERRERMPVRQGRRAHQQIMRPDHGASRHQLGPQLCVPPGLGKPKREHWYCFEQGIHEGPASRPHGRVPRPDVAVKHFRSGNGGYGNRLLSQRGQESGEISCAAFSGNDD
jgi:hypothetical protein